MKRRNLTHHILGFGLTIMGLMSSVVPAGSASIRAGADGFVGKATASTVSALMEQESDHWRGIGPAPSMQSLAINPGNPDIVYAGSFYGVYKSKDAGATWSFTSLGYTGELVIDFINPNIVYAGTSGGTGGVHAPGAQLLFKSTDGGEDWSNASSPIVFDVSLLVMDPTSPNTLYTGSASLYYNGNSGVGMKSTDGGASWKELATGEAYLAPWGWAIDPADSRIIYAPGDLSSSTGEIGGGLLKTTDGVNWSLTGLTNVLVNEVAIDPLDPNTLYAGTYPQGVFKSTDGGASWSAINNGLPDLESADSYVSDITIDRDDPMTLYAGTAGNAGPTGAGVFRSVDGGANWTPYNDGLTDLNVTALALTPDNPNTLYAATSDGVFKIVDNIPGQPVPTPKISGLSVDGKKLFLSGENFDAGAVILLNGVEQATKRDHLNPQTTLIGKKTGKRIKPGDKVQVRNPSGTLSHEFVYTGS